MLTQILKFICTLAALNALPAVFGHFGFVVACFIVLYAIWEMIKR